MLVQLDILDDRLEAIKAKDCHGQVTEYLEQWREGAIDPMHDAEAVLIVELDDGLKPRPIVANDGEGPRGPDDENVSRPLHRIAIKRITGRRRK